MLCILGLQRKFRIMDDNNNQTLSYGEFQKAMMECDLNLDKNNLQILFTYFDKDSSGDIDFEEFLQGLKVPYHISIIIIYN